MVQIQAGIDCIGLLYLPRLRFRIPLGSQMGYWPTVLPRCLTLYVGGFVVPAGCFILSVH